LASGGSPLFAVVPPITNGGFETGTFSGWTTSGTTSIVTSPVHAGSYAARTGSSSATSGNSSLSQTFSVPAGGGTLAFWYEAHCSDLPSLQWATATLYDSVTGTTATLLAPTCTNSGAWVQVSASLAAQAGHAVTLTLTSHGDNNTHAPTYAYWDDVTFTPAGSPSTPSGLALLVLLPLLGLPWLRPLRAPWHAGSGLHGGGVHSARD
jgi:hypothetical protein